jgi:hypothetical protein
MPKLGICVKFQEMAINSNFEAEERKAGNKAAGTLRAAYRTKVNSVFKRKSGALEKSTFSARFKEGWLDRLVLLTPHYSFKEHFGSTKTGNTPSYSRGGAKVRSFQRFMGGGLKTRQVEAHVRGGGSVRAHNKGRNYKARNHIAEALKSTSALEVLATDLGQNRIVLVTSQIDFK